MEYISVNDRLPEEDMRVLVYNDKGWMAHIPANYKAAYGVFMHHDPNYRESLTLEVSHWAPYPKNPSQYPDDNKLRKEPKIKGYFDGKV